MAVINKNAGKMQNQSAVQALTAAALVLPGMVSMPGQAAEGDEFSVQYGHYQEGKREIFAGITDFNALTDVKTRLPSNMNPIEVDTLKAGAKLTLTDRVKFAFNYTQDTWSGATPVSTSPAIFSGNQPIVRDGTIVGASPLAQTYSTAFSVISSALKPATLDLLNNKLVENTQLTHTMAFASPETRKQGDFKITYEWDEAALDVGGGISVENDYESRFFNLGGRWDLNQKLTTLNLGLSYTNSATHALLDHDSDGYIFLAAYEDQIAVRDFNKKVLKGNRQDWGTNFGITQILSKESLIELGVGYTHSTGFMENPYKAVTTLIVDPNQVPGAFGINDELAFIPTAFLEQRPDVRNQWIFNTRFVQYVNPLDAAFHFDYTFFHDNWGIDAHTFAADWVQPLGYGWTVTPRVRYYSQDAADFYTPFMVSQNTYNGGTIEDVKNLPADFSSDHRLSGYGTLSGGVTVTKEFAEGVTLEAGFEYYTHQGSLKLGSGGESDFADFNFYVANAALTVNLDSIGNSGGNGGHSHHHHAQYGNTTPAGIMFGHMMHEADSFMVGYRYMYGRQDGDILHGTQAVPDQTIRANGCPDTSGCTVVSSFMNMHMHMLDLMYAPTDWLNLMLMPQFVDMEMNQRLLSDVTYDVARDHLHGHTTGGVGDTGIYALVKLLEIPGHEIHMGLGVSAPTGDVSINLRRMHKIDGGYIHYGMQLGSGTWDFKPSLTYTGRMDDWSWGAQVSGTKRLESKNESGFAFGDTLQTTAWGSYNLFNWLSASVRGVYTVQGSLKGEFNPIAGSCFDISGTLPCPDVNPQTSAVDFPASYGGRYWDVGFGLNAYIPSGALAGHNFSVEWLQPVEDDVNGFQLERDGLLSASWSYMF